MNEKAMPSEARLKKYSKIKGGTQKLNFGASKPGVRGGGPGPRPPPGSASENSPHTLLLPTSYGVWGKIIHPLDAPTSGCTPGCTPEYTPSPVDAPHLPPEDSWSTDSRCGSYWNAYLFFQVFRPTECLLLFDCEKLHLGFP